MIAESIKAFGFTNPILTDQAAKSIGMAKVPTVCLDNLTAGQIRAYVIADNRLAEKAGWDESILAIELQHLLTVDLGFDVSITGFEVPEIDLILQQAEAKPDAEDAFEHRQDQLSPVPATYGFWVSIGFIAVTPSMSRPTKDSWRAVRRTLSS